jgi:hypothetical protein
MAFHFRRGNLRRPLSERFWRKESPVFGEAIAHISSTKYRRLFRAKRTFAGTLRHVAVDPFQPQRIFGRGDCIYGAMRRII